MKRFTEIFVALLGLLALSPIFLVIATAIRLQMGAPVFFRQTRIGLGGKEFEIIKFRTMLNIFDENGNLLPDTDRLSPLGRFLRVSSLDELPELWNVLRGDMSLVGPRPLLPEYLPLYSPAQARRHEVRPGITGWAQVNGRNGISWTEKFALDVWYIDNQSFFLDCKIIVRTFYKVLRRDGISAAGEATVGKFTGSLNCLSDLDE